MPLWVTVMVRGVHARNAVRPEEVGVQADQGTVRRTVRGIGRGKLASIETWLGLSSQTETVRKAVEAAARDLGAE